MKSVIHVALVLTLPAPLAWAATPLPTVTV